MRPSLLAELVKHGLCRGSATCAVEPRLLPVLPVFDVGSRVLDIRLLMLSAVSAWRTRSERFGQHSFACCLQRQLGHCSGACNVYGFGLPFLLVQAAYVSPSMRRLLMHMPADMLLWPHLKVRVRNAVPPVLPGNVPSAKFGGSEH
jgi:hypothetical protein